MGRLSECDGWGMEGFIGEDFVAIIVSSVGIRDEMDGWMDGWTASVPHSVIWKSRLYFVESNSGCMISTVLQRNVAKGKGWRLSGGFMNKLLMS